MSNLVYDHVFSPVVINKNSHLLLSLCQHTVIGNWWWPFMTMMMFGGNESNKNCWKFAAGDSFNPAKNRTNHVCAFHSDKKFYEQLYYIQTFGTQVLRNIIYKIHSLVFKKILFILLSSFPKFTVWSFF